MAQFTTTIITKKGHALMAKLLNNEGNAKFTKIVASDTVYKVDQLENLTAISGIKQTSLVTNVKVMNDATISVRAPFDNTELTQGYYINTLGLYAQDPTAGEILFSVACATQNAFMPAFNSVTSSGLVATLVTTVSNSSNVTLKISPAATVMHEDLEEATTITDASLAAWIKQEAGE